MGIYPDIGNAQSQLMQAEQLLRSQKYEQSIQYAGAATQLARQVHYAAMQQAMLEQMAAEAEQRRRAARMAGPHGDGISFGAAAATAAAATILERNLSASEPRARAPARARAGHCRRFVGWRDSPGKLVGLSVVSCQWSVVDGRAGIRRGDWPVTCSSQPSKLDRGRVCFIIEDAGIGPLCQLAGALLSGRA